MNQLLASKWGLAIRVLPLVAVAVGLKLALHLAGLEIIPLNNLSSGIVGATIFLLGFLIAGTLADFKESERLPGELAASLESLADECRILGETHPKPARAALADITELTVLAERWLHKHERTSTMLDAIAGLNRHFRAFEPLTQPNFIVRLKQEQQQIRRVVIRIDTIRDTSFVSSGYAVAELSGFLLVLGMVLTQIDPFGQSLFFVGFITFMVTYMIRLIHDLDNPFDYHGGGQEQISLKPLKDLTARLQREGAPAAGSVRRQSRG